MFCLHWFIVNTNNMYRDIIFFTIVNMTYCVWCIINLCESDIIPINTINKCKKFVKDVVSLIFLEHE